MKKMFERKKILGDRTSPCSQSGKSSQKCVQQNCPQNGLCISYAWLPEPKEGFMCQDEKSTPKSSQ